MSKKTRGPNFSANEKEILIHLVSKNKDVVENKRTDAVTTAVKNEGWIKLTEEFNSLSSFCVRNTDQLKTCWDNIKRTTRKEKAHTKKENIMTGGKRNDPQPDPYQGQVETLLGPTLDGLQNEFDFDAQFNMVTTENDAKVTLSEVAFSEDHSIIISLDKVDGPSTSQNGSFTSVPENLDKVWNGWSPAALKTKVSEKLSTKKKDNPSSWLCRRRPKASIQDKLLESKLELVEMTKKNAADEAELKLKILGEQLKTAETEVKLKLEILQEQLKQEKIRTETQQLQLLLLKNEYFNVFLFCSRFKFFIIS